MTFTDVLLIAILLVLVAVAVDRKLASQAATAEPEPELPPTPTVLNEVIVNTRKPDDQALRGLTDLDARGPVLVLHQAKALVGDEELEAGEISVERDHVAWIQHL